MKNKNEFKQDFGQTGFTRISAGHCFVTDNVTLFIIFTIDRALILKIQFKIKLINYQVIRA